MLSHASSRARLGVGVAALSAIALAVQLLAALGFLGYCDENLDPGTSREIVCRAADDGGYLVGIVGPPLAVAITGAIAVHKRRPALVIWMFAIAIGVGVAVPLVTGIVAGYR